LFEQALTEASSSAVASQSPSLLLVPGVNPAASFVALDRDLLGVRGLAEATPGVGAAARAAFAGRLAAALVRKRPAAVILWFAAPGYGSITAALCRLACVPMIVVAGGAEVATCPEVEFGDGRSPWRRWLVGRVLTAARVVWAFSKSAEREILAVAPAARVRVVPPAVDTAFYRSPPTPRAAQALTACSAITAVTIRQKGLDRLLALARARPEVTFVVTGRVHADDETVSGFVAGAPSNVCFAGFVTRAELRALYAGSRVYLQLSAHEGFGVAVVEAMAMGCTPLVSEIGALRELVDEPALRVPLDAPLAFQLDRLDAALTGSYAADRWAELDARFGVDARRAAWHTTLAEL
jgi:glycosyltransferase involved in cell wall biosynthesis